MKPMVKMLTGTAVLTLALAGCASKATTDSAAAGNPNPPASSAPVPGAPSTTDGTTGSTASPGAPSATGSSPTAPNPSASAPGGKPTAGSTDQVKYVTPDGVTVSGDGRTLSTSVEWGGCMDQPTLQITTQDATQVVVEVKTVTHFRMGAMCPNIARVGEASATLNAPLGNRQLIDAVTHSVIRTH